MSPFGLTVMERFYRRYPQLFPLVAITIGLLLLTSALSVTAGLGPTRCGWWEPCELAADEGGNLMKGALLLEGYPLYDAIWSDQPPVLSYLLAGLFAVFGSSLLAARLLMLAFSVLLLYALFRIARRQAGAMAAIFSVFLLATWWLYAELSVTVLIGLPAIALALLALDMLLLWREKGSAPWLLVLSGLLMGLSITTKFFTVITLPLFLCLLLAPRQRGNPAVGFARRMGLALVWLILFTGPFSLVLLVYGREAFVALFGTHVDARTTEIAGEGLGENLAILGRWLLRDIHILILAAMQLVLRNQRRRDFTVYLPWIWFFVCLAVFLWHRPLWGHHSLLLFVPLAWLGGIGAEDLRRLIIRKARVIGLERRESRLRRWAPWLLVLALLIIGAKLFSQNAWHVSIFWKTDTFTHALLPEEQAELTRRLEKYKSGTNWVFSDRPFDVFMAGMVAPPPLAVFSDKRVKLWQLKSNTLIEVINAYDVEQVWLRRYQHSPELMDFLMKENYVLLFHRGWNMHWVKADVMNSDVR
ncbi:MAG: glycosyltransferase family 39 protein [Candidatus Sumerlaeia bacterium]